MFSYDDLHIISGIEIPLIHAYLKEIGAISTKENIYNYENITIFLQPLEESFFGIFPVSRCKITAQGDTTACENFLTSFRLRFLTLGG